MTATMGENAIAMMESVSAKMDILAHDAASPHGAQHPWVRK
jgi:hypothetical protein